MLPTTRQLPVLFPDQAARLNRKGHSMTGTQVVPIDYYAASQSDPAERVHQGWFEERAKEVGTQLRENARKDAYMRRVGGPSRLGAVRATALIGGTMTDPAARAMIPKLLQQRKAEYEQLATAAVDAPSTTLPKIPVQDASITSIDSAFGFIAEALTTLAIDPTLLSEVRRLTSSLLAGAQVITPGQLQSYYAALDDAKYEAAVIAGRVGGPEAVPAEKKRILQQFIREARKVKGVVEQLARAAYSSPADKQLMVDNIRRQQGVAPAVDSTLQLGTPVTEQRPILAPQPTGQGYKKKAQRGHFVKN